MDPQLASCKREATEQTDPVAQPRCSSLGRCGHSQLALGLTRWASGLIGLTQHMPPASLLHRSVALGTPVGNENSQQRPGGPGHAKYGETAQTCARRADFRRQASEYDEYARIPSSVGTASNMGSITGVLF